MAREKSATAVASKATLQNACWWLASRPDGTDVSLAVDLIALLFSKTRDDILKRVAVIQQMAR